MKQSWVTGIVMLYVILQGLTMVVQADSTGDSSIWGLLDGVFKYNLSQVQGSSTSLISSLWVPAQVGISVLMSFMGIVLLYYPALFHGHYIWLWYCLCLPVAVGFVVAVVTIIRGVAST